jgi:hypothetical protein
LITEVDEALPSEMLFHTSWDWLMSVVQRIEDLGYLTDIFYSPNGNQCMSIKAKDHTEYSYGSTRAYKYARENKKAAVYKAVVEFIKWYNKNK